MRNTSGRVRVGLKRSVLPLSFLSLFILSSGLSGCGDDGTKTTEMHGPADLAGFVPETPDLAKAGKDMSSDGGGDMTTSIAPMNAACATPTAITASMTISNEDTTLATSSLDGVCLSG